MGCLALGAQALQQQSRLPGVTASRRPRRNAATLS